MVFRVSPFETDQRENRESPTPLPEGGEERKEKRDTNAFRRKRETPSLTFDKPSSTSDYLVPLLDLRIRTKLLDQKSLRERDHLTVVLLEPGLAAVVRILHLLVLTGAVVAKKTHFGRAVFGLDAGEVAEVCVLLVAG